MNKKEIKRKIGNFNKINEKIKQAKMVNSYSLDIQRELEAKYQENSYIIGIEKAKLAKKCNLTKTQVKNWFLRRRLRGNNENNLDRSGKLCEAAKVVLERKFKKNIFISRPERAKLSKEIQLTEMQILSWFCEKRKKLGVTKECAFPEDVRNELKRTFNKKNYISKVERKNLADKLNITEVQVKNWFNELRKRLGKTRNHIRAQQIKQTLEKQKKERQNLALETAKIWRESHVTLLEESQVDLADFSLNNELKDTPKIEPTTSPSINGPDYNNELNESKRKIFELNKLREDLQISNSKKSQDIESLKIQLKTQVNINFYL